MSEADAAKAQAHLRVGGNTYRVVAAVLMMLGLIESYLHYQEVVPVFTGEVAHRIVELLKVCCSTCLSSASHGSMTGTVWDASGFPGACHIVSPECRCLLSFKDQSRCITLHELVKGYSLAEV